MASERIERRLAAILVADMVGYSRLISADEEGTIARLGALREELMEPYINTHHGRIVKTAGDGLLVEFASAVDAVRYAVEFQRALAERESDQPVDLRIEYRIGINVGDIIIQGNDIVGDGVNVAARLESLAEPGGICISRSARDQVRDRLDLSLKDLGEIEVKNIARPVRVFRVLLDGEAPPKARAVALQRKSSSLRPALSVTLLVLIVAGGLVAWLWSWERPTEPVAVEPDSAPEISRPSRHFQVERPADLAAADALTIYDRIRSELVAVYRKSANPHTAVYQTWRRYNVTPYLSATHGLLYVNNYANQQAVDYGKAETAGTFPVGSVLAKDSFEVTDLGDVFTGPLTLMEKMPPGFSPDQRDWRYTMIMPDGSLFGTTNGENSVRVEYCAECHRGAGDEQDHLFFVPEEYRIKFLNMP